MGFQDPLTIAHVDAELGFSGGETQVFLLMEGLRERGHHNLLFCPPRSRSEAEALRRGIQTHSVPMRTDLDLPAVLRLWRGFLRWPIDVVHLHTGRASWLGGLAAHLAGRTAIVTRRQDRAVRRWWRTRLVYERFSSRAVAISPAVARRLERGGVSPERLCTIPSAVASVQRVDAAERAAARAGLALGPDDFCLLTMVALVKRKGIDVLLEALARLGRESQPGTRRVVTLIAGEGVERPALEARARELGLGDAVRFLGRREDRAALLAACDAFTLPSRSEGLGVAALEAMAVGRAVVASRVGGLGEAVVDDESGLLVEPEDERALARAIARLRDSPELCERLGLGAIERIRERHLADKMVAAYERLYREVLAHDSDRAGVDQPGRDPGAPA